MTRRRGTTLLEALVALSIGLLVVATMVSLFTSIQRMSHASDLAGTLQEAALAMASIHRDLTLAVQKPDPKATSPVMVRADAFQVFQNKLERDGSVTARLVVYQAVPTEGGNLRLRRKMGGEERIMPGTYSLIEFQELDAAGGPFVRVTMRLSVHDRAGQQLENGSEGALLTSLVRVMGPELVTSDFFAWSFLNPLRSLEFSKEF